MTSLKQPQRMHAPYLEALRKVTEYLQFFCNCPQGEPPYRRVEVGRLLVTVLGHVFKPSGCPECNLDLGLNEVESAFLAAYSICSELDGYDKWLKRFGMKICLSDGEDESTIDNPLSWIAIPLAAKRSNSICPRLFITKRRMEEEEIRRPDRPLSKDVYVN
jgi:hypothetical protein